MGRQSLSIRCLTGKTMKKNKMNKIVVGVLAAVVLWAGTALATRGPQGVSYTTHNLSTSADETYSGMYVSDNETQVCVFCHTPHGGSLDGPLWNRSSPATSYVHYNSPSLSTYLQELGVGRAVEKESLLCLSCHDGSIAINSLLNTSNSVPLPTHFGGQSVTIPVMFNPITGTAPGALIGASLADLNSYSDLSDDHPISFKYKSVYDQKTTEFKDIATAESKGIRFFPQNETNAAEKRVECSSCHDPHVMYDPLYQLNGTTTNPNADEIYRPFLITSNAGSALCLACHTK